MKKHLCLIFLISALCALCGCNGADIGADEKELSTDCRETALLLAKGNFDLPLVCIDDKSERFEELLFKLFGISEQVTEGCIIFSDNERAVSFAVISPKGAEQRDALCEQLGRYVEEKKKTYDGYFPEEAEMLEKSLILQDEKYVILIASGDARIIEAELSGYYSMDREGLEALLSDYSEEIEVLEEYSEKWLGTEASDEGMGGDNEGVRGDDEDTRGDDEGTRRDDEDTRGDDIAYNLYSCDRIVAAYNDENKYILLDDKEKYILDEARRVISECIKVEMTDLEKEKAIHDYMCCHMDYDRLALATDHYDMLADSDNPYGMFKNGFGICYGYAATFDLFMRLLEIEAVVVEGSAYDGEVHAWNKVRISGKWYNVDVTWDDPVVISDENNAVQSEWSENYRYFNRSDKYFKDTSHKFEESAYPAA